jgi:hypothetical protein
MTSAADTMQEETENIGVFDRRLLKPSSEAEITADNERIKRLLYPLQGNIKSIYLLPTFDTIEPPRLLKKTGHYPEEAQLPSGMVLHLKPDTPLDSNTTHLVVNHETGMGVSMFNVKDVEGQRFNDQEIEERMQKAAQEGRLPVISSTSTHMIGVYSSKSRNNLYPRYVVIVRANDDAAATAVLEHLKASKTPMTVQELADSSVLNDLQDSSEHVRRQMAQKTAKELGFELDEEPETTTVSHQVVRSQGSPLKPNGPHPVVYKVFANAYNTETSHSGVLVNNGTLGGYTQIRSSVKTQRSQKPPSSGWSNDSTSSSFPTHNGKFDERTHKSSEMHPLQNDETLKAFKSKVHYSGLPELEHPLASEKHASRDDSAVNSWMESSKPSGKSTLEKTDLHFVAGVAPNTSTLDYMSTAELIELAKKIKATPDSKTKAIVVPLDSKVMTQIISDWHKISKQLPPDYTLDHVTSSIGSQPLDPILTTISLDEAHMKEESSTHKHPWHGFKSETSESSATVTSSASPSSMTVTTGPHGGGGGGGGGHIGGGGGGFGGGGGGRGFEGGGGRGGELRTFDRDHPRLEGGRGELGAGLGYGYPYAYGRFGTAALDLPLILALEANNPYWYPPRY